MQSQGGELAGAAGVGVLRVAAERVVQPRRPSGVLRPSAAGAQQAVVGRVGLYALQQRGLGQIGRHLFHRGTDKRLIEFFAAQIAAQAAASDKLDLRHAAAQGVHAHMVACIVAVQPSLGGNNQAVVFTRAGLPNGHNAVRAVKLVKMAVHGQQRQEAV